MATLPAPMLRLEVGCCILERRDSHGADHGGRGGVRRQNLPRRTRSFAASDPEHSGEHATFDESLDLFTPGKSESI